MHTIGFMHEQQRVDRDQYISIVEGDRANCDVEAWEKSQSETVYADLANTEYDFGSIMHYGEGAASKCKLKALNATDSYGTSYTQIGQRKSLSEIDIFEVNYHYPPQNETTNFNQTDYRTLEI